MTENLRSSCPHDRPSACGLRVERIDERCIGGVKGGPAHGCTLSVIGAKVFRYQE